MVTTLNSEDSELVVRYAGFKAFARKYVQLLDLIVANGDSTIVKELARVLDSYDIEKIPGPLDTLPSQRKEIFESVYANLSLLKGYLETKVGTVDDEVQSLQDFFKSRLRSAVFRVPERESDVQDAIEQLLIGRGMQKGVDYGREVGRVKVSTKESVPDFIFNKLSLALEVKIIKDSKRVRSVVDEINADIVSYKKAYQRLLFLVYDLGHIRDETEFCQDFEQTIGVSIIVIKH